MSLIRRIPIPMAALALGTAALGNLLLPYSPVVRAVCGVIAASLLLLLAARVALDLPGVRKELANPAALAVSPTFFMALMVLATYLKPYAPGAAKGLWFAALALQLLLVAVFLTRHVASFKLATVMPGWFLVFVGFVVASVTSPAFDAAPLGRVFVWAGMIGYLAILPVVIYRLFKHGDLPALALPTVAIFAAPPSLLLAGYLSVMQVKQPIVVYALLAMAAVSLLYVATRLPRILSNSFCPSCASLTFPFVISAIALKLSSGYLATTAAGSFIPKLAVTAMDGFAALMVLYVLVRYALMLAIPAEEKAAPATAGA
ncbi:MAG: TDT family transporter [Actinobacteria bacterium]|nr:TDT family transporter [Actinomycetota bacterium]MCG2808256.1 TDT family transporter [Coriobacteriia bacterium]